MQNKIQEILRLVTPAEELTTTILTEGEREEKAKREHAMNANRAMDAEKCIDLLRRPGPGMI